MNKFLCAALLMLVSSIAWAAPPSQDVVKGCLMADSVITSIVIKSIKSNDFAEEKQYADGFNASYMFEYRNSDMGYAESKGDKALIYSGKIYPLSKAIPIGDNHGVESTEFEPSLADWSFVKEGRQKFFCVSFNFSGLGQSGDFQNIRGGYLLDVKTKDLYFAVRDIRK